MADGRACNSTYHFLFAFRDGKICLSKDDNETRHAAEIFGVQLDGTPVDARRRRRSRWSARKNQG
jgi:hypothetical protein